MNRRIFCKTTAIATASLAWVPIGKRRTKIEKSETRIAQLSTSGEYTIGEGGDYATYQSAMIDLGNLNGNVTLCHI